MITREKTKIVKNKCLSFGGDNRVLVQTMCTFKTSKVSKIIDQINGIEKMGADLVRVSVLDKNDAKAIKKIKEKTNIPIVADIHYDYKLALLAMKNGCDKVRINPGNITNNDDLLKIIKCAKKYDTIVRIGVNEGSNLDCENSADDLVNLALKYIDFFEKHKFNKLVVSLKSSDPLKTYLAYRKFAEKSDYPLHIGVTESGYDEVGIIRSVSGLSPLLLEGIGNTMRISLTNDPVKEILTCRQLLCDLNINNEFPKIISCPTCGRCMVRNTKNIADEILRYCLENKKYIKVAIMGCAVNGVGEGKSADIGICGNKNGFTLIKKGRVIENIGHHDAINKLKSEIDKL